jgi:hypothetical protein
MPEFKIVPLDDPAKRSWIVKFDGKELTAQPNLVEIEDEMRGKITIGQWPQGFHGWAFDPHTDGTVTIPWSRSPAGELYVGLIHEQRSNMGPEKIWCPLGGSVERGESFRDAEKRESMEEGGLDTSGSVSLPGLPINADRAYYIQNPHKGEGLHVFGLEIPFMMLEPDDSEILRPRAGTIVSTRESELRFMPWKKATALSADGVALAGIARLLSVLL